VSDEINLRLSHIWYGIFLLIERLKASKVLSKFDNELFKITYVAAVEGLLLGFDLRQEVSFSKMQLQMVDMLLFGVIKR
jgi:hypothetical protein